MIGSMRQPICGSLRGVEMVLFVWVGCRMRRDPIKCISVSIRSVIQRGRCKVMKYGADSA